MTVALKKNQIRTKLLFTLLLVFAALLGYQWYLNRTNFVVYKAFGIAIPINYSLHGIDVSHHNGNINWQLVRAMNIDGIKVSFAFIKATEGVSTVDEKFGYNWQQCQKYKITRGAYHYFNEYKTGAAQAQNFIATVGDLQPGDLPPVLDIESNRGVDKNILCKEAIDWLTIIEQHYGIKPIVYTYVNFYANNLDEQFSSYPFWAAHYNEKHQPNTQRNWAFWQHNDGGNINGITTKVDFNVYNGDWLNFNNLLVH